MQEFVFYSENGLEFPLDETIHVTADLSSVSQNDYVVSNSQKFPAQIVAHEIDFYINNSKDSMADKILNVQKLYEANAIRFDLAQDMVYTQNVENRVLLVANDSQANNFISNMVPDEFSLYRVPETIIQSIDGHIGNLSIIVDDDGKDVEIKVDQIVWFDAKEIALKQSGTLDPNQSSINDILAELRTNITHYDYKKFTTYDPTICQYHERREEVCGKCAEVCPTVAIVKHDEEKHLEFSQIDCHGCGGCISVCPSGAVDYAPSNRETITEMARLYKGSIPLIVPQKNMDISSLSMEIKAGILPFSIEGEKFLHEGTLLTLIQESGAQVIFYSDFLSKGTKDSIFILNQIFQKKYGKDAVLLAMNEEELEAALMEVDFIEDVSYTFNTSDSRKRENFAIRLKNIVGNDDLGVITTGEHVHYAKVHVNEENCTLCLACVGACNVDAFSAHSEDNTLRLNPSLCTACGYCELSCPEKDCITIERDIIELKPSWFAQNIMAKDELFACVECGHEFATKKAVEKIASVMAPLFKADPVKERTLYCCETCKPKVMMTSYMQNKSAYNNPQGVSL